MQALLDLLQSGAIIVIAVMFAGSLGDRLKEHSVVRNLLVGIVFGGVGILSMLSPVDVAEGFRVDARNVVVALAILVAGPIGTWIAATFVASARLWFGGAGAIGGVGGVILVATATSVVWFAFRRLGRPFAGMGAVLALAIVAALTPLLSVAIFSPNNGQLSLSILSYLMPTNFVGVLGLGSLIIGERERRWAVAALKDEQARLEGIANHAPGVLFQLELVSQGFVAFRYVSGGAQRVLGIAPSSLLKDARTILKALSTRSYEAIVQLIMDSSRTMEPWAFETEITRTDGREIWVRVAAEPRVDWSGRLVWDGSIFDVTDQKRAEQRKNDFISTVSHELRTPLTSIRGSLGLIVGGATGDFPEKAKKLLRIAHSNSERLVLLINDILDIEKIESGRMVFELETHNAAELVRHAIDTSSGYLIDRHVKIDFDHPVGDSTVSVDAHRFNQVMLNLLSNAIKYSPVGGTVLVGVSSTNEDVVVSVRDHGNGIPLEFHDRIFGKFEQADASSSREKGGTGLGLSITKAIVEGFGGQIGFESEVGHGTTFRFRLPRAETRSTSVGVDDHPDGMPRVLICEDDPEIARIIALSLLEEQLATDIARDAEEARALLSRNQYVAMTLDIKLPKESGLDLLAHVRSGQAFKNLPVVVISAYIDEAKASLNGSAIGIVDWLEKPIDADRLREAIARAVASEPERRPRVLHIEDDKDVLEVIATTLGAEVDMTFAETASEARSQLAGGRFDVVILDLDLPDGRGEGLLDVIPGDTAVVIFSASDVEEKLAHQVHAALTKTKSSELAIADAVRRLALRKVHTDSDDRIE